MDEDELANKIVHASIEVHKSLGGPGLLESVYEAALFHELKLNGLNVQKQVAIPIVYKGIEVKDPM